MIDDILADVKHRMDQAVIHCQGELNKVAATAIRKLNSENEELKTKLAAYNKAASLVSELFNE